MPQSRVNNLNVQFMTRLSSQRACLCRMNDGLHQSIWTEHTRRRIQDISRCVKERVGCFLETDVLNPGINVGKKVESESSLFLPRWNTVTGTLHGFKISAIQIKVMKALKLCKSNEYNYCTVFIARRYENLTLAYTMNKVEVQFVTFSNKKTS